MYCTGSKNLKKSREARPAAPVSGRTSNGHLRLLLVTPTLKPSRIKAYGSMQPSRGHGDSGDIVCGDNDDLFVGIDDRVMREEEYDAGGWKVSDFVWISCRQLLTSLV
jgi:hypothetical protein